MLYVGLDVHSRQSSLCILNASEKWLNLVAPALMRDAWNFSACDIASTSEVSPA